ncbi:MAG: ribosome biogenesis GTP-binding protein YihA/YsxC [Holosporaceae bacterium]|nr:ribosome biogenesis GTP-binding protein YihA/YsxC [Holosporaceae bacterium]
MISSRDFFGSECKFVAGAASPEQLPGNYGVPEIAFVGRSNVGKSSLINAVVGKRDCARVSKTPGRTRQINFFLLGNKILLADLPGYGYAAISKQMRKSWDLLMDSYIRRRQNLRRAFLLLDSRHGPKAGDEEIMDMLDDCAVPYQIILTKIDKISSAAPVAAEIEAAISLRGAALPHVIPSSAEKNLGIQEIRGEIMGFLKN